MKDSKEMLNRTAERQEMRTYFGIDARRINLLARLLIASLQVCTVNHAQLDLALNAKVKKVRRAISFNVKRLQRFLKIFCPILIYESILSRPAWFGQIYTGGKACPPSSSTLFGPRHDH